MKKLLIILSAAILFSCGPLHKKRYRLEVTYTTGESTILTYQGVVDNYFRLENGDLRSKYPETTLVSGVRYFKVLSIVDLGKQATTDNENCDCKLTLVQTENKN